MRLKEDNATKYPQKNRISMDSGVGSYMDTVWGPSLIRTGAYKFIL